MSIKVSRQFRSAGARAPAALLGGATWPPWLRAMRPQQWTKNAIVLAALVFDRKVFEWESAWRGGLAVLVFCALSSAMYLINDQRDVAGDRMHPVKRFRPIAAGELGLRAATRLATGLILAGIAGAYLTRSEFLSVAVAYVALMIAYTAWIKQIVILDVFAIAAGFVLRAAGGAVAIDVEISPWLLVCTMLLALFIGFGKRRNELATLQDATGHRASLNDYSLPLLDQMIGTVASATVMAYSFYTFDASSVPQNHTMMLTIPFVVYAVFRYLYLIHRSELGGSPETLLFADRPLFLAILSWGLASMGILYFAS